MDYNDSSRQFRPLGSRVMALSIQCDSLNAQFPVTILPSISCMLAGDRPQGPEEFRVNK